MKSINIILFAAIYFAACKKERTTSANCDRVKEYFYDNQGSIQKTSITYNSDGMPNEAEVETGGYKNKYRVEYLSDGKSIVVYYTPPTGPVAGIEKKQDSMVLNQNKYVIFKKFYFSDGYSITTYDYDQEGFLIKLDATNYSSNGVFMNRQVNTYNNTVVEGNLLKKVEIINGRTPVTYEYEYRLSDAFIHPDFRYYFLLYNPGNQSKNLLVKIKENGALRYNITYLFDNKKRLIDIKHTDLIQFSNTPHYAIKYQCE